MDETLGDPGQFSGVWKVSKVSRKSVPHGCPLVADLEFTKDPWGGEPRMGGRTVGGAATGGQEEEKRRGALRGR